MTAEGGYVDAGKLRVEVVADLTGFATDLKEKVKLASEDVRAKVGIDVKTKGFRGRLKEAAKKAAEGVTVKVRVDPEVTRRALKKQIKEAAGDGIEVPTADPKASDAKAQAEAEKATRALQDAQERLNLAFVRGEDRTERLSRAHRDLATAERKHGRTSDQYAAALNRVNEAEHARQVSLTRISRAISDMEKAGGKAKLDVVPDVTKARADLAELAGKPRTATINADADTSKAEAKLDLAARPRTATINADLDKFGATASKLLSGLAGPAIAAGITGLVVSATGLAGALGAVVAAAGPALNTLALLPALAGGATLSIAALVIGLNGLGDAFKALSAKDLVAFNKAMDKLSPAARDVVAAIQSFRPAFTAVRKAIQEELLGGVGKSIRSLGKTWLTEVNTMNTHTTLLRYGLFGVADAMNRAFAALTGALRSQKILADITYAFRQMHLAGVQFARLAAPLTRIVVQLFAAGAPFVVRFAKALADMTDRLSAVVNVNFSNGGLTRFFERAVDTATQLGRILRDLTLGLVHFFGAGTDSGQGMLDTLESMMARFREFTTSTEGRAKIAKFFAETRTIAAGLALAIGYISDKVAALGHYFSLLPEPVKKLAGPLLIAAGAVGLLVSKLGPLFKVFGAIGKAAAFVAGGLSAEVLAAVAVVGLLAGAFYYAWQQSESFRQVVTTAFTQAQQHIVDTWNAVKPVLEMFGRIFLDTIKPAIDRFIETISQKALPVFALLQKVWEEKVHPAILKITTAIQGAEGTFRRIAQRVANFIDVLALVTNTGPLETAITLIGDLLSWMGDNITFGIHAFEFLANAAIDNFDVMVAAASKAVSTTVGLFSGMFDLVASAPGAPQFIKDLADDARKFGSGIVRNVEDVRAALAKAKSAITPETAPKNAAGKAPKGKPKAKAKAKAKAKTASDYLKELFGAGADDLLNPDKAFDAGQFAAGEKVPGVDRTGLVDKKAQAKAKTAATKAATAAHGAANFIATSFLTGLTGTDAQVRSAVVRMTDLVKTALGKQSRDIVELLTKDSPLLQQLSLQRAAVTKQLTAAEKSLKALLAKSTKLRDDITKQVRESFSLITQSGADDITFMTERLQRAVDAARDFAKNIVALKARNLSADLLTQLATAGPAAGAATAQMLAGATDAEIAQLNALYKQLDTTAKATGVTVADTLYGAGIRAAQGLVDGLKSKKNDIVAAMQVIATTLQEAIKKALKIKSPSVVMAQIGASTTEGLEVGLLSRLSPLQQAVAQLAATMTLDTPVLAAGAMPRLNAAAAATPAAAAGAAAGGPSTAVNVYPRQTQDEREIGIIAAHQLEWMRGTAW